MKTPAAVLKGTGNLKKAKHQLLLVALPKVSCRHECFLKALVETG
jgi:hypothetical protein